jgi:hypothetical protein
MHLLTNVNLFASKSPKRLTLLISALIIIGEILLVGVAHSVLGPGVVS